MTAFFLSPNPTCPDHHFLSQSCSSNPVMSFCRDLKGPNTYGPIICISSLMLPTDLSLTSFLVMYAIMPSRATELFDAEVYVSRWKDLRKKLRRQKAPLQPKRLKLCVASGQGMGHSGEFCLGLWPLHHFTTRRPETAWRPPRDTWATIEKCSKCVSPRIIQ